MMEKDEYAIALGRAMEETISFEYVPAIGPVRRMEFFLGGGFGEGAGEYANWCIAIDKPTGKHCLKFVGADGSATVMLLDSSGVFRGRDRKNNGTILLRPLPTGSKKWLTLSDPTRYWQSRMPDNTEKGFFYKEALPPQIDWKPFAFNLAEQITKDALPQSETALAIVGYDRPAYFSKVVQSIAQNKVAHSLPVFVFLDRHLEKNRLELVDEQVAIVRASFPNSVIIKRPRNFGCGRNIIDVRRQLFDHMNYKRVFIFEDDLVVSQNYVKLTMQLMDWAEINYSNVGVVQAWNMCKMSVGQKKAYRKAVQATGKNWWGYLMLQKAWNSIKDMMYHYEELFLGGEYAYRPHRSIKEWFRIKMRKGREKIPGKNFKFHPEFPQEMENFFVDPATGQDAATMFMYYLAGYDRVSTVVNRALYIGKNGIHMNPRLWESHGFGEIVLHEFDDDEAIEHFELLQNIKYVEEDASPIPDFRYVDATGV